MRIENTPIKKITSILLVLMLLLNSMGYFFIFETARFWIQKDVKKQIKAGVPESELSVISISETDMSQGNSGFRWVKKNKEFVFQNQMYDVVRSDCFNGQYTFYCIHDEQETQLFANLNNMVQRELTTSRIPQKTTLIASCVIRIALPVVESNPMVESKFISFQYLFKSKYTATCFYIGVEKPPPELFV